jgi:hypothetical protein
MKKWALVAATCCGFFAYSNQTMSQVLSGTSNITLQGNVSQFCALPVPSYSTGAANFIAGPNSDAQFVFDASDFIDSSTGKSKPQKLILKYTAAMCNFPAYLALKSTNIGMTAGTASATGFSNFVHYTATANWGTAVATIDTSKDTTPVSVAAQPFMGDVTLTIQTQATPTPVVATQSPYSDVLILQIGSKL